MIETIWLVDDKGKESKHKFVNYEIREGSALTIIYCTVGNKESGWRVAVVNHSESNVVDFGALDRIEDKEFTGPQMLGVGAMMIGPIVGAILNETFGHSNLFMWCLVGFFVGLGIAILDAISNNKKATALLTSHISKMGQGILKEFSQKNGEVANEARLETTAPAKLLSNSIADDLERLYKLKADGIITEEEFSALKANSLTAV